jgi:hypothetical protein
MNNNGYKLLVSMPAQEGRRFKRWCRRNNLTMSRAVRVFVSKVTRGEVEIKESIIKNGKR